MIVRCVVPDQCAENFFFMLKVLTVLMEKRKTEKLKVRMEFKLSKVELKKKPSKQSMTATH